MTLHQLKTFEAVVKYLNITKAARAIRISQSSVSKQLRLLEEEYGVKFHLRIGRGIKLTEEGRLFWHVVAPILRQIEDVKKIFLLRVTEGQFHLLKIAGTTNVSVSLLPEVLKAFTKTHPDVQPIFRTADSSTVEQMVLDSEVEIGLITNPSHRSQIALEPLWSQELVAAVSTKHPLARKGKVSLEELPKIPVLIRVGGRIAKELQRIGLKLNIVAECHSSEVVRAGVRAGLGLGFFFRDTIDHELKQRYLKAVEIPCLKEIDANCFIIYRKGVPLSANAQDFLTLLRQWRGKPIREKNLERHGLSG